MRKKDVFQLGIAFFINVVSGIVSVWILKEPTLTALVVLATALCTTIVLLFLRIEEIRKTIAASGDEFSPQPPQCCGLHTAGFSQVFERANQTLGLMIELVSQSYKFLGVSGEFSIRTEEFDFRDLMKRKAREGCRFQILLLDPDASDIVERHGTREGASGEATSHAIQKTIADLRALARECDGNLEVWLYRDLPVFRLVLLDGERAFVSFYGAKGLMGVHAPQLVFVKTDRSFFLPFSDFYERTLHTSKRLI
jgi:hypothetical protein